jgi:site-specific recombinase
MISSELAARMEDFCSAPALRQRNAALVRLTRWMRSADSAASPDGGQQSVAHYLEANPAVRARFQASGAALLRELSSLSLFAEAGIPSDHSFLSEIAQRLAVKFLPSAREEDDTSKLLVALYSSERDVLHFLAVPADLFRRIAAGFAPPEDPAVWQNQLRDLREAMRLLATRIAGIGVQPEVRHRSTTTAVSDSPFYQLAHATEELLRNAGSENAQSTLAAWRALVRRCRHEMAEVHRHMESAGVSVELIFDLKKVQACLVRMEAIARVLAATNGSEQVAATQSLLGQVIAGRLSDRSLRSLLRENLNLIARKMVERTGHSGEHYIAHNRAEYWHMWRAALGGGLFTVITAAIKMRIVDAGLPMFVEGFLAGTNYAVSFVFLQVLGLVLATKQPAATAATFAGIIRNNKGERRSSKLSEFVAHITSTQLAAAIGNVVAVTIGAVVFERLWQFAFSTSFLNEHSAEHIYETLHLTGSGTAFFAIVTGVILWMAALAGGWFENLAVYYRFSDAVAQHPLGGRIGESRMTKLARVLSRNLGGWSTSIVLGYLLGFTPVIGHFFGIPLDVRHVTLSTGTLALAAARFGFISLGRTWFYHAVAGIAVIFVLNLTVSFTISAFVALRAYNVQPSEQWTILRFIARNALRSPLPFIIPAYGKRAREHPAEESDTDEALSV